MPRGIITSIDEETLRLTDEVCRLKYEEDKTIAEISSILSKPYKSISQSKIAFLLKVDAQRKIAEFKQIPTDAKEKTTALLILVKFLRDKRKFTYMNIAKALDISKDALFTAIEAEAKKEEGIKPVRARNEARIEDYIRLNAEGASLSEIAEKYNVSRQAVSALFKKMGYVPKTGAALTRMKIEKHAPELIKNITNDYIETIHKLRTEKRAVQQTLLVHKGWASKSLRRLRMEILNNFVEMKSRGKRYSKATENSFVQSYLTLLKYVSPVKNEPIEKQSAEIVEILKTLNNAEPYYKEIKNK